MSVRRFTLLLACVTCACLGHKIFANSILQDFRLKPACPLPSKAHALKPLFKDFSRLLFARGPSRSIVQIGNYPSMPCRRFPCEYKSILRPRSVARMLVRPRESFEHLLEDIKTEVELERNAKLVELPVMFRKDAEGRSFDFDRWEQHRSPSRYLRLLIGLLLGPTTRRIATTVVALSVCSGLVEWYSVLALNNPNLLDLKVPLTPFELTAPVLGLLLVFRTNSAYERFDRGSDESWQLTSRIRSIIRLLALFQAGGQRREGGRRNVPECEREAARDLVDACCLLHGWLMQAYLQGNDMPNFGEEFLRLVLGEDSWMAVRNASTDSAFPKSLTPAAAITSLSVAMATRLPSIEVQERIAMDQQLSFLTNSLTICEKLLRTPIPLGYTRYSVRFLWVWLTLLPFALSSTYSGFLTGTYWEDKPEPVLMLTMALIGFLFLSTEDIAVQIEEPFAILPLANHQTWLLREVEQIKTLFFCDNKNTSQPSASMIRKIITHVR